LEQDERKCHARHLAAASAIRLGSQIQTSRGWGVFRMLVVGWKESRLSQHWLIKSRVAARQDNLFQNSPIFLNCFSHVVFPNQWIIKPSSPEILLNAARNNDML
jgi:hypothetical protein